MAEVIKAVTGVVVVSIFCLTAGDDERCRSVDCWQSGEPTAAGLWRPATKVQREFIYSYVVIDWDLP